MGPIQLNKGALTQLVECDLCKVEVRSSSLLCSTQRDDRRPFITPTAPDVTLAEAQLIGTSGDQEFYLGVDSHGVELEMILVPDDRDPNRLACIHAMPSHYRNEQE